MTEQHLLDWVEFYKVALPVAFEHLRSGRDQTPVAVFAAGVADEMLRELVKRQRMVQESRMAARGGS